MGEPIWKWFCDSLQCYQDKQPLSTKHWAPRISLAGSEPTGPMSLFGGDEFIRPGPGFGTEPQ